MMRRKPDTSISSKSISDEAMLRAMSQQRCFDGAASMKHHMKRKPKTSNHRRARASNHRKLRSLFCISLTQHALREPNPPHVGRRDGAAGRRRQDQAASAPQGRRLLRLLRKARTSNCRKRCSDYNRLAKRNHMKRKPWTSNRRRA